MAAPVFVPDELVTAAKMNLLPKGVLGYAQVTTNQTGIGASVTDLTGLSVAVTVQAGRRIRISGGGRVTQVTATGTPRVMINEGAAGLNDILSYPSLAVGAIWVFSGAVVVTPSAGSHTYKLTALTSAGTLTLTLNASIPAWILVEDLGAV